MNKEFMFAFPHWDPLDGAQGAIHNGMTLRDYFAAKAMQGLSAKDGIPSMPDTWIGAIKLRTKVAYMLADAMLEARND